MIDFINRYKFSSADPKYIIQLTDPDIKNDIITNWKKEQLGGSTIRLPIKPNPFVAMMKGVPTSLSDPEIKDLTERVYGEVSV